MNQAKLYLHRNIKAKVGYCNETLDPILHHEGDRENLKNTYKQNYSFKRIYNTDRE